jgi:hypothetical protein
MWLKYTRRPFNETITWKIALQNQANLLLNKWWSWIMLANQIKDELDDTRTKIERNIEEQKIRKSVSLFNVDDELEWLNNSI